MTVEELTITEWLEATQARRDELDALGVSPMPIAEDREAAIEKAIAAGHDAGKLLADAEGYLTHAKAQAMYSLLKEDLNARDRELAIKAQVQPIQRLVDGLTVTNRTIQNRVFAIQNANRSRL